jgi:CPA1 family monovalent cation:H+ antiporter
MADTALVLLVIAGLLVVVGISQPLAIRLRLPPSVLLAAIGVGIGAFPALAGQFGLSGSVDAGAGLFADLPVSSVTFIYVFLPLLVFEAGIATDVRRIIEDAAAILVLAVIATLVTTATIGFALWPFAPVPLVVCLLLGAVVSTTDPAAVIAIFRDVGAPARLTRLVRAKPSSMMPLRFPCSPCFSESSSPAASLTQLPGSASSWCRLSVVASPGFSRAGFSCGSFRE